MLYLANFSIQGESNLTVLVGIVRHDRNRRPTRSKRNLGIQMLSTLCRRVCLGKLSESTLRNS